MMNERNNQQKREMMMNENKNGQKGQYNLDSPPGTCGVFPLSKN